MSDHTRNLARRRYREGKRRDAMLDVVRRFVVAFLFGASVTLAIAKAAQMVARPFTSQIERGLGHD